MRILQINKLYFPWIGGVEKHVQDLCEQLVIYPDVALQVLVCSENQSAGDDVINKVNVKKLTNVFFRLFHKTLIFSMPLNITLPIWIARLKSDILHFHLPNPWAVLSYWLTRPSGKLIITWHSDIVKQKKLLKLYAPLERWFLKRASHILVTSPNMIRYSHQLRGYSEKCLVVPLGIDPVKYLRQPEKFPKKARKQILFVGRLVYYKGVQVLVEAMQNVDADLIIVGAGPLKDDINADIERYKLYDKVRINPPVSDAVLIDYFNACDIFVLPSVASSEAFGIVQLEAMICGKPVVSTNLPTGVPFVNEHRKSGLIVEPGNVHDLQQALNELLSDDQLCRVMGRYGKARVLEQFTNEKVGERVHKIYQTLLN